MKILIFWMVFGLPLALQKAAFSSQAIWTGFTIQVCRSEVVVQIPEAKLADLLKIVGDMLCLNVVPIKEVRSLAGKASNITGIIIFWRPFLDELWAAISTGGGHRRKPVLKSRDEPVSRTRSGSALVGCIWVAQIALSLLWMKAFLEQNQGTIRDARRLPWRGQQHRPLFGRQSLWTGCLDHVGY